MSRYRLTVAYDGTEYCGWQIQENAVSVQQVLIKTLESVIGPLSDGLHGCSRTDSGVHADEYVCHFDSDTAVPPDNIVLALNTRLPDSIAALSCQKTDPDFHARYSCIAKTYRYHIHLSHTPDPFRLRYEHRYPHPVDTELLNRAAQIFCGTHDFSAFCASGSSVEDRVRTIYSCTVTETEKDRLTVEITGNGFLYRMVRIIVGTLLAVNERRIAVDDLPKILDSGDRDQTGPTAPAHGLHLHRVYYEKEDLPWL